MYSKVCLSFLLLLALLFSTDTAQTKLLNSPKRPAALIQKKSGHIYKTIVSKDSLRVIDIDLTQMMDIIVEFKDEPMFILQKKNSLSKISMASFQARQSQFNSDISRLYRLSAMAYSSSVGSPQKKREYFKVFNGACMSVPKAMISDIAALDYVKKVHLDKKYKADLKESVKLVGADSVWYKYNDQGDSVIVGIIDTGIDYMHPALGGGIGKGFKVIGGYDLVNKDNDPMDDHGHGTHVSGIVAGNSSVIKGVAPKALLMGFKVLNSYGSGTESDIIAGIEMAVDPNDDNDYSDKVDVANMSLGGQGSPDDALCTAVNNAVRLGVVFCVASGNSGSYYDLGSPASASLAITVGASDKSDKLAVFSSKGSTRSTYSIKPEVLAPGVGIYSSVAGGKYESHDGTSMASPHAAGVCALLKHMHKDWTPEMIKSALVTSAKDLGYDAMAQGAGRINALKAADVNTFISPSVLSFGMDDAEMLPSWTKKDTVKITNRSKEAQSYSISLSGSVSGISISPDLSSFTLQAGESKNVIFTLSVDNNTVPYSGQRPYSYSGMVQIKGTKDNLHMPWAFLKAPILTLEFDRPVLYYAIFNRSEFAYYVDNNNNGLYRSEELLPFGTYNAHFLYASLNDIRNKTGDVVFILKENVEVKGNKRLLVNSKDAVNNIEYLGVDENGRDLASLKNSDNNICFLYADTTLTLMDFNIFPSGCNVKTSNFSDKVSLLTGQFQADAAGENKVRSVQYPLLKGLNNSLQLKNSPNDFVKENIIIKLPEDKYRTNAAFCNTFCYAFESENSRGSFSQSLIPEDDFITSRNWRGSLYLASDSHKEFALTARIITDVFRDSLSFYNSWFVSPPFKLRHDSVGCFYELNPAPDIFISPDNGTFKFGDGAVYPYNYFSYYGTGSANTFILETLIYGQLNEERGYDESHSLFELYDSQNKPVASDSLYNNSWTGLPNGTYKAVVKDNHYTVSGVKGKAELTLDLEFSTNFSLPPQFTSLKVLNSRQMPVSRFEKDEQGKIMFSVMNNYSYYSIDTSQTKVFLKTSDSDSWEEVKILKRQNNDRIGVLMTADIGRFTNFSSAAVDMKITAQNTSKKKSEWVLKPAFIVGNYVPMDSNDIYEIIPETYALHNNYPNPFNPATTISYDLPEKAHVELKIYDMLGREVITLIDKEQQPGKYKARFNGSSLSSGIYICRIKAGTSYTRSMKMLLLK